MNVLHRVTVLWIAIVAVLGATASFAAEDYPNRPIKIIVSGPPGGALDLTARVLGDKLKERVKQPIVIDYRPGGNGLIGLNAVAQSKPDGYILLAVSTGFNIGPLLFKSFTIDPINDLTPVIEALAFPLYIFVNADSPFANMQELVAYAKANPSKLNIGVPAAAQMDAMMLLTSLGIEIQSVPYPGTAPLPTALLGKAVDLILVSLPSMKGLMDGGKVRALSIIFPKRFKGTAEVPTVLEFFPRAQFGSQAFGISGPKGLPKEIVEKLNLELNAILTDPEVVNRFETALAAEVRGGTPEAWKSLQQYDFQRFKKIAQQLKIEPQ